MVPRIFLFIFHAGGKDWILIIFGTQVIKKKHPARSVFPDYLSISYDWLKEKNNQWGLLPIFVVDCFTICSLVHVRNIYCTHPQSFLCYSSNTQKIIWRNSSQGLKGLILRWPLIEFDKKLQVGHLFQRGCFLESEEWLS